MAGSRAADDFVVIRARLAELQRQRDQAVRGEEEPGPKPYRRPLEKRSAEIKDRETFRPFRERFTS